MYSFWSWEFTSACDAFSEPPLSSAFVSFPGDGFFRCMIHALGVRAARPASSAQRCASSLEPGHVKIRTRKVYKINYVLEHQSCACVMPCAGVYLWRSKSFRDCVRICVVCFVLYFLAACTVQGLFSVRLVVRSRTSVVF